MSKASSIKNLTPYERSVLRLVLEGNSFIDFPPSLPTKDGDLQKFLRLNEFDLTRNKDQSRLMEIHNEACGYLRTQLKTSLDIKVIEPAGILALMALASQTKNPLSRQACSVLKTMSIINHIDGRELLYSCPISLRDLFSLVEDKLERSLSRLLRGGAHLIKYVGGRKQKDSLITKLLSRKESLAARINDRVRYRLVTSTPEEIPLLIVQLFREILPFNYIVPGHSVNQLVDVKDFLSPAERFSKSSRRQLAKALNLLSKPLPYPIRDEEHSGVGYRVVKFLVDLPVCLEKLPAVNSGYLSQALGWIGFCLVEFQIVDAASDEKNNAGENRHDLYKMRQTGGVLRRLNRGS